MNNLRSIASGQAGFVALWCQICDEQEAREKAWIEQLRAQGFKAAHPNDGWVDRERKRLKFAYPQFNDGAGIGDLVMLGWHSDAPEKWRPVRLVAEEVNPFSRAWVFEDVR